MIFRKLVSFAWRFFEKKSGMMATCSLCGNDYSYRTSVSNLRKHLMNRHRQTAKNAKKLLSSDDEFPEAVTKERKFSSKRYFDISEDKLAHCKLCYKDVPHESVADLIKHILEYHGDFDDGTDTESGIGETKSENKSLIWLNFEPCADTQIATCLICKVKVSYQNGVSSLKKHIENDHPDIKPDRNDRKPILISADGELYEIEPAPTKNDTDQKDPIQMDTVYLEDFEDYKSPERAFTRRPSFKPKRRESVLRTDKRIKRISTIDSSSEEERPMKKREKTVKKDRIDLFCEYLTSLLKELPRTLSDELQGNMIHQAITAKINYDRDNRIPVPEIAVVETVSTVNQSVSSEVNGTNN